MSDETEIAATPAEAGSESSKRGKSQPRRSTRVEVNGWINLDKPVGVTSTQAVAQLKYLFNAKKAGHAGTLDPLASGVLPVAFGEATKTVPIVQEGTKAYQFAVKWGEETDTDDAEGRVVARSEQAPEPRGDRGGVAALRRPDQPDAADLFGDSDRRRARLRSGARRRDLSRSRRARSSSTGSKSPRPNPTRRDSRPNAARAPMSARSRAISGARSAATAMWSCCAAPASGRSGPRAAWRSTRCANRRKRARRRCCRSKRAWRNCRAWRSTGTAPRSCAADKNSSCAAPTPLVKGPPRPRASALRSPSEPSRTAISFRRGSSTCRVEGSRNRRRARGPRRFRPP